MDKTLYVGIEEKMQKTIARLKDEYAHLRVGRANPTILDKINVEYYGVPSPLNQVASVSVPDARTIAIQPFDASLLGDIEKEIQKADIGINPNNDGKVIRLNFPALTEERRKELVKDVKKMGEDSKVAIRSIRRDAIEKFRQEKKQHEMTEDDLADMEKDIQKITDRYIADIDKLVVEKDKEVLEV